MIDDALNVVYEMCPCGCGMELRVSSDSDIYTKWLDKDVTYDTEENTLDIDEEILEDEDL